MPVIAWYYREGTKNKPKLERQPELYFIGFPVAHQVRSWFVVLVAPSKWANTLVDVGVLGFSAGQVQIWEGDDEKEACGGGLEFEVNVWAHHVNILKHKWMLISSSFGWKGQWHLSNNKHTALGSFPNKRNRGNLGKWMVPRLKQEKYKMSLEHQVLAESTEMTKEWWRDTRRVQEPAWRGCRCQLWNNLSIDLEETIEHWIMMAMDYDILNNRVHEFTLINIK